MSKWLALVLVLVAVDLNRLLSQQFRLWLKLIHQALFLIFIDELFRLIVKQIRINAHKMAIYVVVMWGSAKMGRLYAAHVMQ